jgi:transposase
MEVKRRPSATLADLRAWLLEEHGVSTSTGTVWKTLRQLGLTLKRFAPRRLGQAAA